MEVKTYTGQSNYEILQKIKSEMGDDAVILNTKTEEVNGRKFYTVIAAKESPPNLDTQDKKEDKRQNTEEVWYKEWREFKEQIFYLLKDSLNIPSISSTQRNALRRLESEGVGQDFMLNLLVMLKQNGRSFMDILNSMIKVKPFNDIVDSGICHVMVGPSGVGKTSTILKLALKYKRFNPNAKICLVNMDSYQGKGKLLLKHYAELSNFHYKDVRTLRDGAALMADMGKYDRIYVDTPGLRQNIDMDMWWDNSPIRLIEGANVHLLLSPVYSREQIDHYLSRYLSDKLSSVVWTKLDEACIFGTMLHVAFKTQLPISLITYGPQLKNSIKPLDRNTLWNIIFKHRLPDESSTLN